MYEYYTTNTSKMNNYNSGSGSFNINEVSINQKNTPGFELVLFLLAFVSIFLIKKRRK
jgi:hypothetical protein